MDMLFDRIPRCHVNGIATHDASCMTEYVGFAELTFYDPTIPAPARWKGSNILLQFGYPPIKRVPKTWWLWRVGWQEQPVNVWESFNQQTTLGNQSLWPYIDPPIRLSNGSFASNVAQLDQGRTK